MAWCGVVEPRTLRECRIALGKSQAAFAAMLGVSPESYRTWDAGRRATPPKLLARARALAAHRNDHELLPLPVLALLIGVHVKTLRAAARDGRLPVTYDTKTTFRQLRARATPAAAWVFRRSYYGRTVKPVDRRAPLTWASVPDDYDVRIRALRKTAGARGATVVVPPARTANVSGHGPRSPARDRTITLVKTLGRRQWKKASGYHRQSRVENTFFRDKSIIGDGLRARSPAGQGSEVVLGCEILNRMTELGRPVSYRIGQ